MRGVIVLNKYIIHGVIVLLLLFLFIPLALKGLGNVENEKQTYNIPDRPVNFDEIFEVAETEKDVDFEFQEFSILSTKEEELSFNNFSSDFNFRNNTDNENELNNFPTEEELSNLLTFGEKKDSETESIEEEKNKVSISGVYSDKKKEDKKSEKIEDNDKKKTETKKTESKKETKTEVKKEKPKTETPKKVETKQGSPVDSNQSDVDMLAKIIWAEARGEPYKGKLAVGAVVVNRVKSPKFPNTIRDVIYAPKQFTPVSNGQFDRATPGEEEYRAAKEALSGLDPTNGALYFYAPNLTTQRWHETLTHTVTIGSHKFFK